MTETQLATRQNHAANSVDRLARRRRAEGRRRTHGRQGAVAVEAGIVLPIVFLFILGVFEFGRYLMVMQLQANAAREAARYAIAHTQSVVLAGVTYGNATSDVTNVFDQYAANQKLTSQSVTVYLSDSTGNNIGTWTSAQAGQSICVRVTGTYNFVIPSLFYLPSTLAVDIKSVMRTEGN